MIEPVVSAVIGDVDVFNAKVKFSAIVASALLAYAGIMLSQWRTRVRENKAHLRSKYEEIVLDLIAINSIRLKLGTFMSKGELHEEYKSKEEEVTSLARKLEMLLTIYAPNIKIIHHQKELTVFDVLFRGWDDFRQIPYKAEKFEITENSPEFKETLDLWLSGFDIFKKLREDVALSARKLT